MSVRRTWPPSSTPNTSRVCVRVRRTRRQEGQTCALRQRSALCVVRAWSANAELSLCVQSSQRASGRAFIYAWTKSMRRYLTTVYLTAPADALASVKPLSSVAPRPTSSGGKVVKIATVAVYARHTPCGETSTTFSHISNKADFSATQKSRDSFCNRTDFLPSPYTVANIY